MVISLKGRIRGIMRGYGYSGIIGEILFMFMMNIMYSHRNCNGLVCISGGIYGGLLVEDWLLGGEGEGDYYSIMVMGNGLFYNGVCLREIYYLQDYRLRINRFIDIDYGLMYREILERGYNVVVIKGSYLFHWRLYVYFYLLRVMGIFYRGILSGGDVLGSYLWRYRMLCSDYGHLVFHGYLEALWGSLLRLLLRIRGGDSSLDFGHYGRNGNNFTIRFRLGNIGWVNYGNKRYGVGEGLDISELYGVCKCISKKRD